VADETKNVEKSINDRVDSELGTLTIHYPGTEFDSDGVTEWIRVEEPDYTPRAVRSGERDEIWTVSFNCFARTGAAGETIYRVSELADLVLAAFNQHDLAVLNWAAGDPKPTLFYLRFDEGAVTVIEPPEDAGKFTMQRNVTFTPRLIG
jgi:hypothetical protein